MRRRADLSEPLRCSFCQKSQDAVSKILSTPRDYPRAHICNECVAICASIIDDDFGAAGPPMVSSESPEETHPLLTHALASPFLAAVERWLKRESLGVDAAEEFAEMRGIAIRMMRGAS